MSDQMRGIPFQTMLIRALEECRTLGKVFDVPLCKPLPDSGMMVAGRPLSIPVGPAAGPHTQLAHNLLAGYAAGGRVFELKTVQILEGEALGIVKPCIYVRDEAYNTEWSTELTVREATEEYIKGWIAMHILANEWGRDRNFQFHISVGYDLAGIQSPKVDAFLNTMKDASEDPCWKACIEEAVSLCGQLRNTDEAFIRSIDPHISNLVTLSTMHGCPADEIERIAAYLLEEKGISTYIKCNPTLLGYGYVRGLLNKMGYEDLVFDTTQFDHDMKLDAAVSMIERLMARAKACGLTFGVKLTNTFPVKIQNGELSGEDMYLSGKPLFLLAINVARALSEAVDGQLPISFSGGIDTHNLSDVLSCGIAPVTVATLLLKTGGYKNLTRLVGCIPDEIPTAIQPERLQALCSSTAQDDHYRRTPPMRKAAPSTPPPACHKCNNCVDVCPNRANVALTDMKMAVHVDSLCNECGNCACLCPFGYTPYKDKFTWFETAEDFENSQNDGFLGREKYRWKGQVGTDFSLLPDDMQALIHTLLS